MMPWGHFAVAFLPYVAYRISVHRALPSKRATLLLLFATQFPDLVDKPLAWTFHLIPSGRMLAHSVVVAIPLVLLLTTVAIHLDRTPEATLFTFGYLSHLYTDSLNVLHQGADYYFLPNLFWPLVRANPDKVPAFLPHLARIPSDRYAIALLGLLVLAALYAYPTVAGFLHRRRSPSRP